MTFGPILAVAAAIAAEGRWSELTPEPTPGTLVASVLQNYNKECWMNNCAMQLAACAEFERHCEHRFFCAHPLKKPPVLAPDTCFGQMRWEELSERELGVFSCAAEHQCINEDHPSLSFLQEEMLKRGKKGLSFLELDSEAAAKKVASVMQLRTVLHAAQTEYARIVAANARTELQAVENRMAKLMKIEHPNSQDILTFAALNNRVKALTPVITEQIVSQKRQSQARPLDFAKIAKMPLAQAQAPYLKSLKRVLDASQRELAIKPDTGRGTPRMRANSVKLAMLASERMLEDAVGLEANLEKAKTARNKGLRSG